jgi:L-threonylcarbamoyladenylate synthase
MQTRIVKFGPDEAGIEKIKEAAAMIDAGALVAFPTETVYGIACRARNDSLARLDRLKGRSPKKRYTLHIGQQSEAKDYVPTIGLKAQKLIIKAWPGPLTIVFKLSEHDIIKQQTNLGAETFQSLYQDNSIGIRCPDNTIASILLQQTQHAVVAPSANITGQEAAVAADQVLDQFSGQIELLLDGGPCKYKKNSTVVKVGKKGLKILRSGVYSPAELEALATIQFLFVCTGNTCRSPMAEGIFRKYLAEKVECKVDDLDKIGYKVVSAGVLDMAGAPASAGAIAACAAKEIDIRAHKSTKLSRQLIEESDFIFAMEQAHRETVCGLSPDALNKCTLLAQDHDIPDPIGQPQELFNNCAEMIEEAIKKKIDELVI